VIGEPSWLFAAAAHLTGADVIGCFSPRRPESLTFRVLEQLHDTRLTDAKRLSTSAARSILACSIISCSTCTNPNSYIIYCQGNLSPAFTDAAAAQPQIRSGRGWRGRGTARRPCIVTVTAAWWHVAPPREPMTDERRPP
jgi:hypothetical protein